MTRMIVIKKVNYFLVGCFIKRAVKPLPLGRGYKALVQHDLLLYTSFIQFG